MKRKRCRKKKVAAAAAAAGSSAAEEPDVEGAAAQAAEAAGAKAGRRKRKRAQAQTPAVSAPEEDEEHDEEEEDEEEGAEEEDGESESGEGEWDVDFELFEPDEEDFHSVKDMITSGTWEFTDLNFSELADSIVGQGNIGNLVKSGKGVGDEDATVCALLTVLNLQQFSHQSWPAALRKALLAKASKSADPSVQTKLEGILTAKAPGTQVGLLVSERFANLPPQLIPPLHKAVLDDIEWSCSTPECPKEERPFYRFTHFLGVARCTAAGAASSEGSAGMRKKRRREAPGATGGVTYLREEDEIYVKRSDFSFVFTMPDGSKGSGGAPVGKKRKGGGQSQTPEKRTVFCLSRKAFEAAVAEVQTAIKVE